MFWKPDWWWPHGFETCSWVTYFIKLCMMVICLFLILIRYLCRQYYSRAECLKLYDCTSFETNLFKLIENNIEKKGRRQCKLIVLMISTGLFDQIKALPIYIYIYIYIYIWRFIMFSVIINIYNKKNQRTYLNGIVHSDRKTEKVFFVEN